MIIVGLTGSIGMGKSVTAAMLRRDHIPVYDADAAIHRLLGPGGAAVAAVAAAFPDCYTGGMVDRAALGRLVFADCAALARLERILHPMAGAVQRRFLAMCRRRRARLVVLDVPLLLETGGARRCDAVMVVSAPGFLQRWRVLRRPGMEEARFAAIRARQMPDHRKRLLADYVIPTGLGRAVALRHVRRALYKLTAARGFALSCSARS